MLPNKSHASNSAKDQTTDVNDSVAQILSAQTCKKIVVAQKSSESSGLDKKFAMQKEVSSSSLPSEDDSEKKTEIFRLSTREIAISDPLVTQEKAALAPCVAKIEEKITKKMNNFVDEFANALASCTFLAISGHEDLCDKFCRKFYEHLLVLGIRQLIPPDQLISKMNNSADEFADVLGSCTFLAISGHKDLRDKFCRRFAYEVAKQVVYLSAAKVGDDDLNVWEALALVLDPAMVYNVDESAMRNFLERNTKYVKADVDISPCLRELLVLFGERNGFDGIFIKLHQKGALDPSLTVALLKPINQCLNFLSDDIVTKYLDFVEVETLNIWNEGMSAKITLPVLAEVTKQLAGVIKSGPSMPQLRSVIGYMELLEVLAKHRALVDEALKLEEELDSLRRRKLFEESNLGNLQEEVNGMKERRRKLIESQEELSLKRGLLRNEVDETVSYIRRIRTGLGFRKNALEGVSGDVSTCKVCLARKSSCVLLECGHMLTCLECGNRLTICPVCRKVITVKERAELAVWVDVCGSVTEIQRRFRNEFNRRNRVPRKNLTLSSQECLLTTGSVLPNTTLPVLTAQCTQNLDNEGVDQSFDQENQAVTTTRDVEDESDAVGHVEEESGTVGHVEEESDTVEHVEEESDTVGHVYEESATVGHVDEESDAVGHVEEESDVVEKKLSYVGDKFKYVADGFCDVLASCTFLAISGHEDLRDQFCRRFYKHSLMPGIRKLTKPHSTFAHKVAKQVVYLSAAKVGDDDLNVWEALAVVLDPAVVYNAHRSDIGNLEANTKYVKADVDISPCLRELLVLFGERNGFDGIFIKLHQKGALDSSLTVALLKPINQCLSFLSDDIVTKYLDFVEAETMNIWNDVSVKVSFSGLLHVIKDALEVLESAAEEESGPEVQRLKGYFFRLEQFEIMEKNCSVLEEAVSLERKLRELLLADQNLEKEYNNITEEISLIDTTIACLNDRKRKIRGNLKENEDKMHDTESRIRSIRKRLEKQQNSFDDQDDTINICKICVMENISCVFMNCGHMATCIKCGKDLVDCPVCFEKIQKSVQVFQA
ncbi:unnamed protein product [Cyprideis torosa]|uniref:Uncharacterized protein n=1 Tax=Cyprideis torosa TaxID=163714 RepID=A0A7R8ZJP7_9CRUS|nr:unnamed protein product [Cyprideis torosa]CAG0882780.1 unnamed protein product [Cyprideis torosa]